MIKKKTISGNILYREAQQYRQTWIWLLFITGVLVQLVILFQNRDEISNSVSYNQFLFSVIAVLLFSAIGGLILYHLELEIIISEDGIFYRWKPFMGNYVFRPVNSIVAVRVIPFPWFRNTRGRHLGHGSIHAVDFSKGVEIKFSDGKTLFLGSQKLKRLEQELNRLIDPDEIRLPEKSR